MLQNLERAPSFRQGWTDRRDANLEPTVNYAPASSLRHLYGAFGEIDQSRARQGASPAI